MTARIIIGIAGTLAGFFMVWKSEAVFGFTGRIDFAEKYLGTDGGTRLFIKIMGVIVIFIAWMYAFNLGEVILQKLFLPTQHTPQ
jgi:predicted membrane-bound mannosyltransferase